MVKKKVPKEKPLRAPHRTSEGSNGFERQDPRGIRSKLKKKKHDNGLKPTIFALVFTAFIAAGLAVLVYFWYSAFLRDMVKTPLNAPKLIGANDSLPPSNAERFWGSYRSGLYFGLKTRTPYSPVFGMMWINQFQVEPNSPPTLRHWCSQGDGLLGYGWTAHDGVNFGIHEMYDTHYDIKASFVKRPHHVHGGDWTARFSFMPKDEELNVAVSLLLYMALDGESPWTSSEHITGDMLGDSNEVRLIRGYSPHLGAFKLHFPSPGKSYKFNHLVTYTPSLSYLNEAVKQNLRVKSVDQRGGSYLALDGMALPHGVPASKANLIMSQITFNIPFEMEVIFESGSFSERPNRLSGETYTKELAAHNEAFNQHFDKVFSLKAKGYDIAHILFAQSALSNMLGSIGYFYGSSLVTSRQAGMALNYWPAPLYTAVPSRSFFPRGFLWDEGFHNLLISRWNRKISMDIIAHWLDLINVEGWIPREQILGAEARARVPDEFVLQSNDNANPPTLYLPLRYITKDILNDPTDNEGRAYLKKLFPRLRGWYDWYNRTQRGLVETAYRWRGRNASNVFELNPKTLTSGLDDYPRASHPTDDERHVDLRCWMALASSVMADIGRGVNESYEQYVNTHSKLIDNHLLDELHWSKRTQRYSDYGLHTDNVKLERPQPPKNLQPGQRPPPVQQRQKERVVRSDPSKRFVDSGLGYVNLFPFLLRILNTDSKKLNQILEDIKGPLWTKFGLRSLEKRAPLYGKHNTEHDPPYWRGAIWININYLALGALKHYSASPGPFADKAAKLYNELRENVVENIYEQYRLSRFIWEQYDDDTGAGKGCHPFTGWSALVVSIMAEHY